MALNIAVPLSGVGSLSQISPIGLDSWEHIKMLVSPIGSESSGVSSLDSEDAKLQLQPALTITSQDIKIIYNGRDLLDLGSNLQVNNKKWNLRYTYLPESNNIPMFLANRSQYHRLGENSHIQGYSLNKCEDCDFQYPVNSVSNYFCQTSLTISSTTNATMTYTGIKYHHNRNNNINYNNNNSLISDIILKKTTLTPISKQKELISKSETSSTSSSSSFYYDFNDNKQNLFNNNKQNEQSKNINNKSLFANNFNNINSFLHAFNTDETHVNNNNNNNFSSYFYNNNNNNSCFSSPNSNNTTSLNNSMYNNGIQTYPRMYKYF